MGPVHEKTDLEPGDAAVKAEVKMSCKVDLSEAAGVPGMVYTSSLSVISILGMLCGITVCTIVDPKQGIRTIVTILRDSPSSCISHPKLDRRSEYHPRTLIFLVAPSAFACVANLPLSSVGPTSSQAETEEAMAEVEEGSQPSFGNGAAVKTGN